MNCGISHKRQEQAAPRRDELSGSTITITSLGALGGIVSTPIINYPEVAIIGINRTQQRPVFQNNGVTPRLMMNISSSFDHRVVDGHDAACAIRVLKGNTWNSRQHCSWLNPDQIINIGTQE